MMARTMEGVDTFQTLDQTSAFGAKPQQVDQPVPGEELQQQVAQLEAEDEFAGLGLPDQAPIEQEDEFAGLGIPDAGPQIEEELEEIPDITEDPVGNFKFQLRDSLARAKVSFAASEPERLGLLTKIFGEENVRRKGGEFLVRNKNGDKFRKFDQDGFEMINDVLDFSREAVEEAAALPFEAGGALVGGLVTGTPIGAGPGILAGRAISVPAQIKAADFVGEILGVERDPERSFLIESAIGTVLQTTLPFIGGKISKRLANRQAAKDAGREAKHTIMDRGAREIEEISQELKNAGIIQNIPGTDTPMLIWQVHPDSPGAKLLKKQLGDHPAVRNIMTLQAEAMRTTMDDMLEVVADMQGKVQIPDMGKKVSSIADMVKEREGRELGKFRMMAAANLKNRPMPLNEKATANLDALVDGLGLKRNAEGLYEVPANVDDLLGNMGASEKNAFKSIANAVVQVKNHVDSGGVSMTEFEKLVEVVGERVQTARRQGGKVSKQFGALASNLRASWDEAVEFGLQNKPNAYNEFKASKQKFIDIIGTQNSLARSLSEEHTAIAFVRSITSDIKNNIHAYDNARKLLAKDHSDVWRKLNADILTEFMSNAAEETSKTGLRSATLLKKLNGLGKDFTDKLFEGSEVDPNQFKGLLRLMARVEKQNPKAVGKDLGEKVIANIGLFVSNSKALHVKALFSLLRMGKSKDENILNYLNRENYDVLLGKVPKKERGRVKKLFDDTVKYARAIGMFTAKTQKRDVREALSPEGQIYREPDTPRNNL